MNRIGFIGTGNMGSALAKAAAKNSMNEILLANRHPEKAEALSKELGCGTVTDNETVAAQADYIFLGVKPHLLAGAAAQITGTLAERKTPFVIVSMIAGTSIEKIQSVLGGNYPVIRIMPNTPAAVGEGMILYSCSKEVGSERTETFLDAMSAAGKLAFLDESLIDAGSSVSGCGPAFVAMFIEALADGGVACGLPRATALECAAQTVAGTALLMLKTGKHPGAMKDAVCSPGGTTIQGVRALEEGAFRGTVMDAVIAAYEKTLKL